MTIGTVSFRKKSLILSQSTAILPTAPVKFGRTKIMFLKTIYLIKSQYYNYNVCSQLNYRCKTEYKNKRIGYCSIVGNAASAQVSAAATALSSRSHGYAVVTPPSLRWKRIWQLPVASSLLIVFLLLLSEIHLQNLHIRIDVIIT